MILTRDISIHAPTRGATMYQSKIRHIAIDFNPRSHEGSDWYIYKLSEMHKISIHAPTRGATYLDHLFICIKLYFNPRSHEGSDHNAKLLAIH